nr:type IIL restriction-modification enzyme MmeI [uncultured Campylobacter sp.]
MFTENSRIPASNINGYLADAPNIAIESRNKPLCNVPEMGIGNKPIDDGNYLFKPDEMNEFIAKEPNSKKYFKRWYGADEFINGKIRYCLWLGDCPPNELRSMPECMKRIKAVRDFRLASKSEGTRKIADKPTRFHVENMPNSDFILVPRVTSAERFYIPFGFLSNDNLASDATLIIPNATLADFAILTSSVHMEWMRAVAGRLKSDYRYSANIVYNNFPFASLDEKDKEILTATAQGILDARALFSDCSLADLYNTKMKLEPNLLKAHEKNDQAVLKIYGIDKTATPSDIVKELFTRYEKEVKAREF